MGTSKGNYVGGKWIKEKEALEIFESISPIDESVLWQGEKAANNTINLCVEVANEAQEKLDEYGFRYAKFIFEKVCTISRRQSR